MRIKRYFDMMGYYASLFGSNPSLLADKALNFFEYAVMPRGSYCYNLPISAQIEPTLRCNLKCTMCVRNHFRQGDMKLEDFKKIISQMGSLVKIHLQGLGEPFLNKDIFSMIDYANSRKVMVSIITNGTLLNDEIIARIVNSDIFEMGVSIDAVDKKSYEAIRVGANFDRVIGGVKKLSSELKKSKRRMNLFFAVTVLRSNVSLMPEFVKLAKSVGINRIVFQRVQTKDDFIKYYEEDFRKSKEFVDYREVMHEFIKTKPFSENLGIKIFFEEKKVRCMWPWRGIYITWTGDVTPCCMIVDPKSVSLGNILETPIRRLWNNGAYRMLRKSVIRRKAIPACAGCRAI